MYKKLFAVTLMLLVIGVPFTLLAQEDITFLSTQFNIVEEGEKFNAILGEAGYAFTGLDESALITQLVAEADGTGIDVVGALHGTFPPLADENLLMNLIDVLEDLEEDREFAPSFVELGLLGTDDYLYYIPWIQATYIMAAHVDALEYLPEDADLDALTWEQLGVWCRNIFEATGEKKCGLPHAGLFHRFLEGYLYPSFTGGMVTGLRSEAAVEMFTWVRDELWPYIHEQSISYEFMQEPLLAGEVWVPLTTARSSTPLPKNRRTSSPSAWLGQQDGFAGRRSGYSGGGGQS
jgi:multiple sugar transport system substrate-binding protein